MSHFNIKKVMAEQAELFQKSQNSMLHLLENTQKDFDLLNKQIQNQFMYLKDPVKEMLGNMPENLIEINKDFIRLLQHHIEKYQNHIEQSMKEFQIHPETLSLFYEDMKAQFQSIWDESKKAMENIAKKIEEVPVFLSSEEAHQAQEKIIKSYEAYQQNIWNQYQRALDKMVQMSPVEKTQKESKKENTQIQKTKSQNGS